LQVNKLTIQPVFNNIIIQTGPVVVESSPERAKSEKLHKDPLTAAAFATFVAKAADIEQSEDTKSSKKHCLSRRAKPRKETRRHQEPSPPAPLSRDSSNDNTL